VINELHDSITEGLSSNILITNLTTRNSPNSVISQPVSCSIDRFPQSSIMLCYRCCVVAGKQMFAQTFITSPT